jgi:hypothetical protein
MQNFVVPNALIYFRVSDPRQVSGTSLDSQEKECCELVRRNGWNLDSTWCEEGESAKSADRKVLKAMLAYCKERRGKVQFVVFPKIDRFARYTEDYLFLKGYLRRLGIEVVSVGEPIENTPAGRFTEVMLAAVAQLDNEVRAERCRGGQVAAVTIGAASPGLQGSDTRMAPWTVSPTSSLGLERRSSAGASGKSCGCGATAQMSTMARSNGATRTPESSSSECSGTRSTWA